MLPKNCAAVREITLSDPRITVADSLSPLEINRAGIKKRSYKHTVHKIVIPRPHGREIDEENVYHCVVEYATPLMSLYEMFKHPEADFSRQERDHQVKLPVITVLQAAIILVAMASEILGFKFFLIDQIVSI